MWRGDVVVITTAQLYSTKPELRLCASSNPARDVLEIRDALRAYEPMCLRAYVPCLPKCLRLLRGYVPCITTCHNFSGAYVPIYFLVPTCFHALNYFLPTCTYSSRACVPKATQKYIEAQLCTSYCCLSMDYLTFHSILNPKNS